LSKLNYYDLLGKPFRLGARGPDYYDCWGLCLELGRRVGISFPADFTPSETSDQDMAICNIRDRDFTRLEKPEPYAIVTFKMNPPLVDHCGFIIPDDRGKCTHFIHIMRDHHVVVLRLDHRVMARKLEGIYKYHGRS